MAAMRVPGLGMERLCVTTVVLAVMSLAAPQIASATKPPIYHWSSLPTSGSEIPMDAELVVRVRCPRTCPKMEQNSDNIALVSGDHRITTVVTPLNPHKGRTLILAVRPNKLLRANSHYKLEVIRGALL